MNLNNYIIGNGLGSLFKTRTSVKIILASLLIVTISVVGFVFIKEINLAKKSVLSSLGFGVAPVSLWISSVIMVFWLRRSWLRPANLWIASFGFIGVSIGVMGFFDVYNGFLSEFTLYGEVSLGGNIGSAIIGNDWYFASLTLAALSITSCSICSPALAKTTLLSMRRVLIYSYVVLILALGWLAKKSMRTKQDYVVSAQSVIEGSEIRNVAISPVLSTTAASDSLIDTTSVKLQPQSLLTSSEKILEHEIDDIESDVIYQETERSSIENSDTEEFKNLVDQTTPQTPIPGKFNKFWNTDDQLEPGLVENNQTQETNNDSNLKTNQQSEVFEWDNPSMELLESASETGISKHQVEETAEIIVKTLTEYGVEVEIGDIRPGPTVTMYGLIPGWVRRTKQVKKVDDSGNPMIDNEGKQIIIKQETKTRVKVDSILSREKDLALALKTPSIRIETPAMGTSQVGIEVPNPNPSLVAERSVMESDSFLKLRSKAALPIALGKGSGGETVVADLAKMPHLLIAGATGSGKSVCINAILGCLLMEKSPAEMRLLLIDPKRVELTPYNGIPHLLSPVVVETDQVVGILKGLIQEMMDRYRRFENAGVRNIDLYNKKMENPLPYLVVAVDELADLMMTAAFDVEQSLCRLAQLGRATGIHLIIATQRPSVDVVTGLIKANFPSRIAFAVSSQVDSRTILDSAGADRLLGRGDMLYLPIEASTPKRIQNVFISDIEIDNVVSFWQRTKKGPMASINLRILNKEAESKTESVEIVDTAEDVLINKAVELGRSYSKLSTSLLQRRLRIGYPRAARLMDQLEEKGIIGPSDGSKSRDVIINQASEEVTVQ